MRSTRISAGPGRARGAIAGAFRLIARYPLQTLALGALLGVLPALVKAWWATGDQREGMQAFASWANGWMDGALRLSSVTPLISQALATSGRLGFGSWITEMARQLALTPLLLTSLALLYGGRISMDGGPLAAARAAAKNVRALVLLAVLCMIAGWLVQMLPSLASALLSMVAGLLSWIPFVGTVAGVLNIILSLLLTLLTDFAVTVLFCFVWISAALEGLSGPGALVRSWQLTRNAWHETLLALVFLTLIRWAAVLLLSALWLLALRPAGVPLATLIYAVYAVSGLHTTALGALASALYQRRPQPGGPSPDQFAPQGDLSRMKRANID